MIEKGKVIESRGFEAKVSIEPSEACKHCAASHFCRPAGESRVIEVENKVGAHVGDEVCIEISAKIGFFAFFLLFGLPVILGLVGIVLGTRYGDTYAIFLGVAGLALGLIIAKTINNIVSKKHTFLPHIVEIVKSNRA